MDPQLMEQQSISINSIPDGGGRQMNNVNSLLNEIESDQNTINEVLGDIEKQSKSLQQDIALNRLMEERQNDVRPPNPFMQLQQQPQEEKPSNIPSNIMTQQPQVLEEEQLLNEIQENFDKLNKKPNFNKNDIDDEIDENLIIDDNKGFFSKIIDNINIFKNLDMYSIAYQLTIISIVYYIFNFIEIDLIITATLSSLFKTNLLMYRNSIGALTFAIILLIVVKLSSCFF